MQPELKVRKILGKTYLNENRLSDALDVFSKILMDYPDDIETLHILGNFYLASGDGKTAQKIYLRAQQLDPGNKVIQRQLSLAEDMGDTGLEEPVPTDITAVARLLQRLTGKTQTISENDIMRAADLLDKIINSERPAALVDSHLDEIDELLPALIELNIRQAYADGRPELAESLRSLQLNIDYQLIAKGDEKSFMGNKNDLPGSHFNGDILFLMPELEQKSNRMALLKSTLESFGCRVWEKREYNLNRDSKPDVVITSNPHLNPSLLESLSALSIADVPIILDLDTDFEKQPISHPEYSTKGLGTHARSSAYTSAISLARMVTVPSVAHADSLKNLVENVCVIPDGWSNQNKLWQKDAPARNTINIGWLGTNGQLEDLVFIRRYVIRIIREFSNTRVAIIGNPQAYRLFENLPENRRMYLPAVTHEESPYLLSQMDILLVPLRNTPYNLSQPDTLLMEAGAKGIPWVASSIPSFYRWQNGGVISESLDEWHLNMRHLVTDDELRRRLGKDGRSAADSREMNQVGKLWLEVINQVTQKGSSALSTTEKTVPSRLRLEH
jgi:glycosyltransferase involved in cell wall biosynthesis